MSPVNSSFVVVARGRSAAVFREGDEWTVQGFPAGSLPVDVTFRTAQVSYGFEAKAPQWLYAEVRGAANSLEDAIRRFPNIVRTLTPLFDVALNASVDDLDLHLGFDATPERDEREFFQNFLPETIPTPRQVRPVDAALLSALFEAFARHAERVRIHRAAAHYQQALRFWSPGDETRAVGQLWMGFEALTPVAKRSEMDRTGTKTSTELAAALNVELKALDPTLRKELLFLGDESAYSITKRASDGFEHGFIPLDELRELARGTRDRTATHLRAAIIRLSKVTSVAASQMLAEPYSNPIIGSPLTKYLRGKLKGTGELAAEGQRYPAMTWRAKIERMGRRTGEGYNLQWKENITPKLGPKITLTDVKIELWSGDKTPGAAIEMRQSDSRDRETDYQEASTSAPRPTDIQSQE
jgi:hypothetical protein